MIKFGYFFFSKSEFSPGFPEHERSMGTIINEWNILKQNLSNGRRIYKITSPTQNEPLPIHPTIQVLHTLLSAFVLGVFTFCYALHVFHHG